MLKNNLNTGFEKANGKAYRENAFKRQKAEPSVSKHPDHSESLPRLKKIQGQIDGVANMINDRRYCTDIIIQIRAAVYALKAVEAQVIERHLGSCIRNAAKSRNADEIDQKISELVNLYIKGL